MMTGYDSHGFSNALPNVLDSNRIEIPKLRIWSADNAVEIIFSAGATQTARVFLAAISLPFGIGFALGVQTAGDLDAASFVKTLRSLVDFGRLQETTASVSHLSDEVVLLRNSDGQHYLAMAAHTISGAPIGLSCLLTIDVAQGLAHYLEAVNFITRERA